MNIKEIHGKVRQADKKSQPQVDLNRKRYINIAETKIPKFQIY